VDVPASACAVEPGSVGEVVAELLDELADEQPATPSPTEKTQSATDMDKRDGMKFLRDRRS
jgi:hypothetical protein